MKPTSADLLELYRVMLLTRRFEERTAELFGEGRVIELVHASIGQEAIGVGACYGLRSDDYVVPHLRTRAALIARGVPIREQIAGMFGKATIQSRGKATTHHMGDLRYGIVAGSGILGASIPIAVGVALSIKLRKKDQIVLCFFGDGSSNRGDFHEGLNLAGVWKLPVVFICEANMYALSEPYSKYLAIANIADRAAGYGFPGVVADGNDVLAVHEEVQRAAERARRGGGATLIECKTYRWRPHREGRSDTRPKEELEMWKAKCPIRRFETLLLKKGVLTAKIMNEMRQRIEEELNEAIEFAGQCPFPDPQEALQNVYVSADLHGN